MSQKTQNESFHFYGLSWSKHAFSQSVTWLLDKYCLAAAVTWFNLSLWLVHNPVTLYKHKKWEIFTMLIFGNLRIFFLISLRKTVSVVKKHSLDITRFFAWHWPMSDASIQICTSRKAGKPLTDMRLIEKEKKCIEAVICRSCSK